MFLIIGLVRRGRLTGRNDPLDPHALSREQVRKKLRVGTTGKVIKEIHQASSSVEIGGLARSKRRPHKRHAGHRQAPIAAIGYYPFKNRRWFILEKMREELCEKPPV
jgi:hypothetical protein